MNKMDEFNGAMEPWNGAMEPRNRAMEPWNGAMEPRNGAMEPRNGAKAPWNGAMAGGASAPPMPPPTYNIQANLYHSPPPPPQVNVVNNIHQVPPPQVTVVNVHHGQPNHPGFKHGVCDCCSNCGNCCCGTFCAPCLACSSANRVGSSGCLYLVLTCLFPCLAMCLLKGRARSRLGITDGNCCEDCCTAFFCTECVNCQVANEIDSRQCYR